MSFKVTVIGLGKLGLPLAGFYSSRGVKVSGYDKDPERIKAVKTGNCPVDEPGLADLLVTHPIEPVQDPGAALKDSEAAFIVVNTPSQRDGSLDASHVLNAAASVKKHADPRCLIVIKSTVSPGTTRTVHETTKMSTCYSPEFIALGSVLQDLESPKPGYAAVGQTDKRSGDVLECLYKKIYGTSVPIVRTSAENVEITKYASNAFFTLKISFINFVTDICTQTRYAEAAMVSSLLARDQRIGPGCLVPGLGFGGPCYPKDLEQWTAYSESELSPLGLGTPLFKAVAEENEIHNLRILLLILGHLGMVKGKRIAFLGTSYKPGIRLEERSAAADLVRSLEKMGAHIQSYEPPSPVKEMEDAVTRADCCVVAVAWPEFKPLQPSFFTKRMRRPLIIDLCNMYAEQRAEFSKEAMYIPLGVGRT